MTPYILEDFSVVKKHVILFIRKSVKIMEAYCCVII